VGVDQAGHDDEAPPFDDLRARRGQGGADVDDQSIVDVHVAIRQVRLAGLHRHHVGVADDDVAARRQIGDRRRDRRLGGHAQTMHCAEGCNAAEKCAPTDSDFAGHVVLPFVATHSWRGAQLA